MNVVDLKIEPARLDGYRGSVLTGDAGYNGLALQPCVERLACMVHTRRKSVEAQKIQPRQDRARRYCADDDVCEVQRSSHVLNEV